MDHPQLPGLWHSVGYVFSQVFTRAKQNQPGAFADLLKLIRTIQAQEDELKHTSEFLREWRERPSPDFMAEALAAWQELEEVGQTRAAAAVLQLAHAWRDGRGLSGVLKVALLAGICASMEKKVAGGEWRTVVGEGFARLLDGCAEWGALMLLELPDVCICLGAGLRPATKQMGASGGASGGGDAGVYA